MQQTSSSNSTSPRFLSLAERDRRHAAIQERMAANGLDVLILPASANRWEQSMADSRYATGIGGFGTETLTIVPRGQAPTAYLFNRSAWWKSHPNRWVDDVRDGRNAWGRNIIERLTEAGFTRGRIGWSGFLGGTRTPDGTAPQFTVKAVQAKFPQAEIVDGSAVIQDLRSIKSAEEVAVLEESAAVTDAMVAAMVATARPGVTERAVYAALVHAMLLGGADLPSLLIFASGRGLEIGHGSFVPTDRVLQDGDLLVNELEARIAGYGAQTVAPVWLGRPDPGYRAVADTAEAVFAAVLERLRPGETMRSVTEFYNATIERESKGTMKGSFPLMHARGLGDEVPAVIDAADLEKSGGATLVENMVFVLKPRVRTADGKISAQVGDTVVVTPSGGRRLGRRKFGLSVVP
ncbi:MAG: M24 family metallopeptidase [Candidatus Lustribacter sp.]|jgi:Xaa-Pro aminopeptidase